MKEFDVERIILFGSRAVGGATADSDVDLLVIMPIEKGERAAERAAAIRSHIQAPFPVDIIVRSPEEIERRIAADDGFIRDVLKNGVLLYEAQHA